MDPLAVMGLVSSLITFIDFAWKLANGAKEIYESADGMSPKNIHIANVVQDLHGVTSGLGSQELEDSLQARALKRIASKCTSLSDELLGILIKLRVTEKDSRWDALKVKWASMCKKQEIAAIRDQIVDHRSEIILHLNTITLGQQSLVKDELDKLRLEFQRFSTSRVQEFAMLRRNLESVSESLHRSERSSTGQQDAWLREARDLFTSFRGLAQHVTRENKVLRHIYFDTMYDREDAIHDACGETYEWLLEQAQAGDAPCYRDAFGLEQRSERRLASEHLTTWLRDMNGVFHMSGKPGSGKSTAMKLIYGHTATKKLLSCWAQGERLITAHFYFWSSGDPIQRSLEGLYRSILFEVLKAYPEIIPEVFPDQWESLEGQSLVEKDDPIFASEMSRPARITEAFRALVAYEKKKQYKFCFFIDGLDELGGDSVSHWELAESINEWTSCDNVKCCVSSRPYTEFLRTFPEESRVYLNSLNKLDIWTFCRHMFETDRNFKRIVNSYVDLVTRIVEISEGVFLWARLVTRIIVSSIGRYDSEKVLLKKLETLPKELENLYDRLLGDLDPVDQTLSDLMFFVALNSNQANDMSLDSPAAPLGALAFSYLPDLEDDSFPSPHQVKSHSKVCLCERLEQVERQISSLTKGILEVGTSHKVRAMVDSGDVSAAMNLRVRFFHRTAADYIMSSKRLELDWVSIYTRLRVAEMASYNKELGSIGFRAESHLSTALRQLLEDPLTGEFLRYPSSTALRLLDALKVVIGPSFPSLCLTWEYFRSLYAQHKNFNGGASFDHYVAYLGYQHYILSRLPNPTQTMHDHPTDILLSCFCGPSPDVNFAVSLLRAGYSPNKEIEVFRDDLNSEQESTTVRSTVWLLMISHVMEYMAHANDFALDIDWNVVTQRVRILMEFILQGVDYKIIIYFHPAFSTEITHGYCFTTLRCFILAYLNTYQPDNPIPLEFRNNYSSNFLTQSEGGPSSVDAVQPLLAVNHRVKGYDVLHSLQCATDIKLAAVTGGSLDIAPYKCFRLY